MAKATIRPRFHRDGTESYEISVDYGSTVIFRDGKLFVKRIRKSHTCTGTREEALKAAGQYQAEADGKDPSTIAHSSPRLSLREWNKIFISEYCKHLEESTRYGYKENLAYIDLCTIGQVPLSKLNRTILQKFFTSLSESSPKRPGHALSARTIRHIQTTLHRSLACAKAHGLVKFNAAEDLYLPKRVSTESGHYEVGELKKILAEAKHESKKVQLLVSLFTYTGMRRGEGAGLRFSDIDWKKETIHICNNRVRGFDTAVAEKQPKSRRGERTITIPSALQKMILSEKKERIRHGLPAVYVLANNAGNPYSPDAISKIWHRFLNSHPKIRKLKLHSLRHSQMCMMIENGVTPAVAADRLGDTIETAMCAYAHSSPQKERSAAEKIEQALN